MTLAAWWRRLRGRPAEVQIDDASWRALLASSALFARYDEATLARLRGLAGRFLARKAFSGAGGHVLDDAQCLAIAALACLPLLGVGADGMDGWRDVVVYPGGFRVRREHHDEQTGVVTEGDDELIGEAWDRGPVILSWADVEADLAAPFEGFNVVVHEIAHKLDLLDGAMNGVPRLPPSIARRDWIATMQAGYDDLVRAVEAGADTAIDPYAAESPDEYFAVLSEAHFSTPDLLADEVPAVARLLARLYAPMPAPMP